MTNLLTPNFAVFNGHINDADARARRVLREQGMGQWLSEVETIEHTNGGIMAIFNREPTAATAAYVALVTAFVNETPTKKD
jgi:hypothetical protein